MATQRVQLEYLRLLLEFGANPNAADEYDGRTAAHVACADGIIDAAVLLHSHGADFTMADRWGRTPIDLVRAWRRPGAAAFHWWRWLHGHCI